MAVDMRILGQILQDGMNLESQRFHDNHGNLDSKMAACCVVTLYGDRPTYCGALSRGGTVPSK